MRHGRSCRVGISISLLADQQGLDLSASRAAAGRIDGEQLDQLLLSVLEHIEPARLAEPVARHWHPGHLGALGYAWLSSSTLMTGLLRLERHWRIVSDLGRLHAQSQCGRMLRAARGALQTGQAARRRPAA